MYTNTVSMLRDAKKRGYAVIGADAWSLDSVRNMVCAAVQRKMPLILMLWEKLPEECSQWKKQRYL